MQALGLTEPNIFKSYLCPDVRRLSWPRWAHFRSDTQAEEAAADLAQETGLGPARHSSHSSGQKSKLENHSNAFALKYQSQAVSP